MKTKLIMLILALLCASQSLAATRSVTSFPVITPIDADYFIFTDTSNSGLFSKATMANTKTALGIATASVPVFAGVDLGVASTTTGLFKLYGNTKAYPFEIHTLGADAPSIGWRWPSTIPSVASVIAVDTNGYWSYLPSTAIVATGFNGNLATTDDTVQEVAQKLDDLVISGTDDQTAAEVPFTPNGTIAATDVQTAIQEVRDEAGTGGGDMILASAQTVTGAKTFDPSMLLMKGTSTGVTTFATANTGASNYTLTFPAATGTVARTADIPTPLATVRTTAGGGSTTAPPNEAAVGDALALKLSAGSVTTVSADVETMMGSANNAAILSNVGAQSLIDTEAVETTGTLQGKMVINSYTAAQTLTLADHNASVVQMTTADEVTMWDCETAGVGAFVLLWARDAEKIEVVPASGDHFNLFAGTALTADYELDIAATAGTKVTLMCTADDTWSVYSETSASTDGGAAD